MNWDKITIRQAEQAMSIEMPEKLKKIFDALDPEVDGDKMDIDFELTNDDIFKNSNYYGSMIEILLNQKVDNMQPHERERVFNKKLAGLVHSLYYFTYIPQGIKSFRFRGVRYYLPKTIKILDNAIPMTGETALSYSEGVDTNRALVELKEYNNMSQLVAIFCRRRREKYSEQKTIERTELFKDLPMSIFWEVFFCLHGLATTYTQILKDYLLGQKKA